MTKLTEEQRTDAINTLRDEVKAACERAESRLGAENCSILLLGIFDEDPDGNSYSELISGVLRKPHQENALFGLLDKQMEDRFRPFLLHRYAFDKEFHDYIDYIVYIGSGLPDVRKQVDKGEYEGLVKMLTNALDFIEEKKGQGRNE